jgi:hypothetical protein
VRVQALPPNPGLHAHVAVHLISVMAHDLSTLPDGSEYTHAPFPEHTEPWSGMKGVRAIVRLIVMTLQDMNVKALLRSVVAYRWQIGILPVTLEGHCRSGTPHFPFVHCPYKQSLPILQSIGFESLNRSRLRKTLLPLLGTVRLRQSTLASPTMPAINTSIKKIECEKPVCEGFLCRNHAVQNSVVYCSAV